MPTIINADFFYRLGISIIIQKSLTRVKWITYIQVKGPSKPLTTEQLIELLSDPRNKDPAKLGNMASNVFASMDRETVDVDKVSPLPSLINPFSLKLTKFTYIQEETHTTTSSLYTETVVPKNSNFASFFALFLQEKYRKNFSQRFQHF